MPRVRIPSVRSLDRFRPSDRVVVDWLSPHPDGLHFLLDRALGRHFGLPTDAHHLAPALVGGESIDMALATLHGAGFELWAVTAQPEHAVVYTPLPNGADRIRTEERGRLRARFFVTRRTPPDPSWKGAYCPWCAGARPPSAS
jgi:hypothetical protein